MFEDAIDVQSVVTVVEDPVRTTPWKIVVQPDSTTTSLVPYQVNTVKSLVRRLFDSILGVMGTTIIEPEPEVIDVHVLPRRQIKPKSTLKEIYERMKAQSQAVETGNGRREYRGGLSEHYRQFARGSGGTKVVYWYSRDSRGNFTSGGRPRPLF